MQESDLWMVFATIVAVMLAAEILSCRKSRVLSVKRAGVQTLIWVVVAMIFGILVCIVTGDTELTLEYLTAYAIEETMSMDNLFVFIVIFAYFGIRDEDQHKALYYGVIGAIVFRAVFIFVGVELLNMFDWLLYVFGILLLAVAVRTLFDDGEEKENGVARFMKSRFDYADGDEAGGRLFVRRDGKRIVTAILVCIVVIEISDIIFALDSIPAVLAISRDTLVIYTSNIFAVMGLRSLFFVIKGGLSSLVYLKYGLGVILTFVAVKLLIHDFADIPILVSLAVILVVLAVTVTASVYRAGFRDSE